MAKKENDIEYFFQKDLAKTNEFYRSIVENSLIGIIIIDDNFNIIYSNQVLSQNIGYSINELINTKFYKYLAKESKKNVIENYNLRQQGKNIPSKYQISLIRKDGIKRNFLINSAITKNSMNKYETIVHLFDITKEKKNEEKIIEQNKFNLLRSKIWKEALKFSTHNKNKIIDSLLEIIGTSLDINRVSFFEQSGDNKEFVVVNQWCDKKFKSSINATITNNITKYFAEQKQVEIPKDIDKLIKNPAINKILKTYVKLNFKKFDLKNFLILKLGETNNPFGLLSFDNCKTNRQWLHAEKKIINELADIISIKLSQLNSQTQLEESERKHRLIIDNALEGIHITQNDKLIYCNNVLANMFGYNNAEELIGIDISKLTAPKSIKLVKQQIQKRLTNKKETVQYEFSGLKKDGTIFFVETLGNSIIYNNKPAIQGVMRDISKRKKAEIKLLQTTKELHELNATKDKFFSIIAHDLKNPFNVILGFSELLHNEYKNFDSEETFSMIKEIYSTSKHSFDLLENLLQWSRMQMKRQNFEPTYFYLHEIINSNINLLKSNANKKNIKLFSKIQPNTMVYADINMISTVIRNLISNALKYTENKGIIYLESNKLKDKIQINIVDSGVGIKKENIDKLFKIDSNISTSGTANEKGTGLGLIICKEFIEKNNGEISFESTEGKGSTFGFSIPLSE